jgi:hypothetical protein
MDIAHLGAYVKRNDEEERSSRETMEGMDFRKEKREREPEMRSSTLPFLRSREGR